MHTLYWSPDTGAFVVQAVLEELGLPYRRIPVDRARGEHQTPAFLALNPMGQVPVLRLPDGTVMTETAAMVLQLCDGRPEPGLLPAPGTAARAAAYRWLLWLATGLYETDLRYYYPARYTSDPAGAEGVRTAALARMDRLLAQAESQLAAGPYLLGERYSAVDPYLLMLTLWHPAGRDLHVRHPGLGAHAARLRARPALARIWPLHFSPDGGSPWSTWTGSSSS